MVEGWGVCWSVVDLRKMLWWAGETGLETCPGPVQLVAALEGLGGEHPVQLVLVLEEPLEEEPWLLPGKLQHGRYHELC